MAQNDQKIVVGDSTYDCTCIDPVHMPTLERMLRGTTKADEEIERMEVPTSPKWLVLTVRSIRWYRRAISPRLGNRCVFEPSCSHYAELAFRRQGFLKGTMMTFMRLLRCRAKVGGVDEVGLRKGR
jgi:putative membrane protein insertion efficiency factor